MEKFILSLHKDSMRIITSEARRRGVSIQELIRAVIIPDWVRTNLESGQEQVSRERTIARIVGLDKAVARRQSLTDVDSRMVRR